MLHLSCRRSARRTSLLKNVWQSPWNIVMFHIQKQDSPAELEGSSLQPLRESAKESPTVEAHDSPEELFNTQTLNDLKNLADFDLLRKNF